MRRSTMTRPPQNNMAKKQRGEAAPSLRTAGRAKQMEGFSLLLESSDDEGPEEVTFEDSKADALRSMKQALDIARREKELLKEKRRKRQELFQQQKKRKLLPAEVLEEIDSALSKEQEQSYVIASEEEAEPEEAEGTKRKPKTARILKGNYTVTTLKQSTMASSQLQAAEDFLHSRLYGPGSRRTTSNEMLSLENKKGKNKSAAVQFVKKDWAGREKAKAEKLKKRWIHKQQIPSS